MSETNPTNSVVDFHRFVRPWTFFAISSSQADGVGPSVPSRTTKNAAVYCSMFPHPFLMAISTLRRTSRTVNKLTWRDSMLDLEQPRLHDWLPLKCACLSILLAGHVLAVAVVVSLHDVIRINLKNYKTEPRVSCSTRWRLGRRGGWRSECTSISPSSSAFFTHSVKELQLAGARPKSASASRGNGKLVRGR